MKNNIKGCIILLVAAILWGSTFVAQRNGALYVGPFTFTFFRSIIAVIILAFITYFTDRKYFKEEDNINNKKFYFFASFAGLAMFLASILQQAGLQTISASKSGFLTSLYIVFVPLIGLFLKKKVQIYIWFCVICSLIGSYLLSATSGFVFSKGEVITIICAIFFALQIIFIDKASGNNNPYKLCLIQMGVVATLSFVLMVTVEKPSFNSILKAAPYVLYAGIFSSCIAYTMQVIGQKYTEPTLASLVMSLESVFGLIFGFIILKESLLNKEIVGCILIFLSVIISQIPLEKIFKRKRSIN